MKRKLLLTSLLLAITFGLQARDWSSSKKKFRGNKEVKTITRTVGNFNGITVGGSFEIHLIKGEEGKITIEAQENIIPHIETEVKKSKLKIQYKKNSRIKTNNKVIVTVYFKDLESMSVSGSGEIRSKDIIKATHLDMCVGGSGKIILQVASSKIKATIGGSGNIELSGKTIALNCKIAGSGNIKSYALTTTELNAIIAGSGNIKATVLKKMKVSVAGSGNVYYKGTPKQVNTSIVGSGNIIDQN